MEGQHPWEMVADGPLESGTRVAAWVHCLSLSAQALSWGWFVAVPSTLGGVVALQLCQCLGWAVCAGSLWAGL
jgi:hypothetical protein